MAVIARPTYTKVRNTDTDIRIGKSSLTGHFLYRLPGGTGPQIEKYKHRPCGDDVGQ